MHRKKNALWELSHRQQLASYLADQGRTSRLISYMTPFLDRHDIAAGEDWEARLGGLIAQSDTVVFVVRVARTSTSCCPQTRSRPHQLPLRSPQPYGRRIGVLILLGMKAPSL